MRVLAVTGASGGHIFPALGFLDTLRDKRKDIETLLVLPRKSITGKARPLEHKVKYISISSIKPKLNFGCLLDILRFLKGSYESLMILVSFRPDVVVGFGSLACVPMVLFAWLLGMKTLIHEQNVIPGRANRLLARFTDRIAVSFEETGKYLKDYKRKLVFTGIPIRVGLSSVDKNKALEFFGFNSAKFTILVMGGSQGSRNINSGFLRAVSAITDKSGLQVIHLAGSRDIESLKENYNKLGINYRVFDFLEPMQYAYSACDLAVSRAGAATIAEIISFGLPAIFIPYPFAYEHQMANARILKDMGSAVIIDDRDLDTAALDRTIQELINNPGRLKNMRSSYGNIRKADTNGLLVEAALTLS